MDKIEQIENLMYSYNDWSRVAHGKGPNYCFEIEKNDQILFYFGANHSRDINNLQYEKLRKYWQNFFEKTKGLDSIVLVEGGTRQVHENEELAARRDSEAGFITLLANRVGIVTNSPEPNPLDERRYVLKNFSEDELDYYYFSRLVNAWHSMLEPKSSFEKYIERYSQKKPEIKNWKDYGFPLKKMREVHQKILKSDFAQNDKELFSLLVNPTKKENPLYQVVRATSTYRNIFVVQEIEKLWHDNKNIFVVYGGAHPILQEPALRTLLK
ncbi:MAG: hypothetical protein AAB421_02725 [Patescibacteria group bacterium]